MKSRRKKKPGYHIKNLIYTYTLLKQRYVQEILKFWVGKKITKKSSPKNSVHHPPFHVSFFIFAEKKRQRHVERQKKNRAKVQEKHEKRILGQDVTNGFMDSVQKSKRLYPAIELLRDPQGLAELILKRLRMGNNSNYKFQVKLLMINFLTRLVGNHELLLLPLYPYLQRYMGGHQRDVTAVLAYTVQACHSLVPPDEIYGILKTIAHNFITERCSGEQMAVGINAARAICSRCPSVMNTEDESFIDTQYDNTPMMSTNRVALDMEGFAQDLAGYAKHKDRSAAIAGRAWYVPKSCIVSSTSFNCTLIPCFFSFLQNLLLTFLTWLGLILFERFTQHSWLGKTVANQVQP